MSLLDNVKKTLSPIIGGFIYAPDLFFIFVHNIMKRDIQSKGFIEIFQWTHPTVKRINILCFPSSSCPLILFRSNY